MQLAKLPFGLLFLVCCGVITISVAAHFRALVNAQTPPPPQGKDTLVYIGTEGEKGKGIHFFRLQPVGSEVFQNVTLVPLGLAVETRNPTFFELDAKRRLLFSVNEIDQFKGKPTGAVSAFSIEPTGKLTLINQRSSMGARPCHLALDADARNLLVANCGDGSVAAMPIAADGKLGEATDVVKASSAAAAAFDRAGRFAFICDSAADKLLKFSFDAAQGKLRPATPAAAQIKSGSSPRRLMFSPDGKFGYALNQKSSTITAFSYDPANGGLSEIQTISTVPDFYEGPNAAIELQMHHSGKWFYVSNTGQDSLVQFTVDVEKGTLTYLEEQGTGGRHVTLFGVQPNSLHLAMALPDNNQVLASRIDKGNGRLSPSGLFADVPSPTVIRFLPPAGGDKGGEK
jgi:6-phosphogluconolactonase